MLPCKPQPICGNVQIELKDGEKVEVFEHGMSLSIVALRGSVPTQWIMDYRSTLGKYAGFGLGQRQQLKEIFEVRRLCCVARTVVGV